MPTVTITPSGNSYEAAEGATLLSILQGTDEKIISKCGGEADCGKCHIFVHDGRKSLSRISPAENAKLDTIVGVGSKSRLACQAKMGPEDVTVEILGFASGF